MPRTIYLPAFLHRLIEIFGTIHRARARQRKGGCDATLRIPPRPPPADVRRWNVRGEEGRGLTCSLGLRPSYYRYRGCRLRARVHAMSRPLPSSPFTGMCMHVRMQGHQGKNSPAYQQTLRLSRGLGLQKTHDVWQRLRQTCSAEVQGIGARQTLSPIQSGMGPDRGCRPSVCRSCN